MNGVPPLYIDCVNRSNGEPVKILASLIHTIDERGGYAVIRSFNTGPHGVQSFDIMITDTPDELERKVVQTYLEFQKMMMRASRKAQEELNREDWQGDDDDDDDSGTSIGTRKWN